MPAAWPEDVPFLLRAEGAARINPEAGLRSPTDSGFARQRQQFTSVQKGFSGAIPMTQAQLIAFEAWYADLSGGTFTHPRHPFTGAPAEARFIVGSVGQATYESAKLRWLQPVAFEFV